MKKILFAAVLVIIGASVIAQNIYEKKLGITVTYSYEMNPINQKQLWIQDLECHRKIGETLSLGVGIGYGSTGIIYTHPSGSTIKSSIPTLQGYVSCRKSFGSDSRWLPYLAMQLGAHYEGGYLEAMGHTGLGAEYKVNDHNGLLFEFGSTVTALGMQVGISMGLKF